MSDKISCCLIIRDEASTLRACLESLRPHVDEICVLDTGSTDDSVLIAKQLADKVETWTGCNDDQGRILDFAAARNRSFELASHDWVCWADGDDVVVGADQLRKLVSGAARGLAGPVQFLMPYEYQHDSFGRCTTLQMRERLMWPRKDFVWQVPVHEGCLPKPGVEAQAIQIDAPRWIHRIGESKKPREPGRNLRILEAYVQRVGEGDVRALYYLGVELAQNGHVGRALGWLKRYVQLASWTDEKMLALLELARLYQAMGDQAESLEWALRASITKSWPEPHWVMGKSFCLIGHAGVEPEYNYRRAARAFELGLEMPAELVNTPLMRDPTECFDALAWQSVALHRLGSLDAAIAAAESSLAGRPGDAETSRNLQSMLLERVQREVKRLDLPEHSKLIVEATLKGEFKVERVPQRSDGLRGGNEGRAWDRIVGIEPTELKKSERRMSWPVWEEHREAKLDIIFFLGHQLEPWTPRTLEANGMGGSETMAWEMSKRLAALGHRVRVYAHVEKSWLKMCDFDGVEWHDESAREGDETCDVLICSRNPAFAQLPIKAAARVLWVHDVHCGDMHPSQAVLFDEVWCLSQWHREFFLQQYPWLAPGKVKVTRNGIDPERFRHSGGARIQHRAIYSSSPDRGLAAAVEAWPAVRAAIPDAELHVFYGFENWERTLVLCGDHPDPHCNREALNQLKMAIAKTKGIVLRGRVNGAQLAKEMLQASVWCYPTWFSETSCITAMEAQAAGLDPVCTKLAALAETVLNMPEGMWLADTEPRTVAAHVIACMQQNGDSGRHSPKLVEAFGLDALAQDWQRNLTALVRLARTNVVPTFMEAAQ